MKVNIKMNSGFIINVKKYKDKDCILTILSDNMIISGLVKYGNTKKNAPILQSGNLVYYDWHGRDNSLGLFKIEPLKSYANIFMSSRLKLLTISSMCEIVNILNLQITNIPQIFKHFNIVIKSCMLDSDIIDQYLIFEALLIINTGLYNNFEMKSITSFSFLSSVLQYFQKNIPNSRILLEDLIKKIS